MLLNCRCLHLRPCTCAHLAFTDQRVEIIIMGVEANTGTIVLEFTRGNITISVMMKYLSFLHLTMNNKSAKNGG